jgi:hypothetical protein
MLFRAFDFWTQIEPGVDAQTIAEAAAMIDAAAGSIIATLAFSGGFLINSLPWFLSLAAMITAKGD